MTKATQIPYFDGDYWPNVFEDSIKELHEEKEKKKCDNVKTELVQQVIFASISTFDIVGVFLILDNMRF